MKVRLDCFLILTMVTNSLQKNDQHNILCDHPDCYVYAAEVVSGIDTTKNPCEDFWEYACGNWPQNIENPDHLIIMSNFIIQDDRIAKRLKGMLTEPIASNEPEMMKNAKRMYKTCVYPNYSGNFHAVNETLKNIGTWNLGSKNILGWIDVMKLLKNLMTKMDTILPFKITIDRDLKMNNIAYPMLNLPNFNTSLLPMTFSPEQVVALALEINPGVDKQQALEDAQEMINLKPNLEKMINQNDTQIVESIDQFNDFTKADWLPLFQLIFAGIKNITGRDLLNVKNPSYYPKMVSYASTPQGAKSLMNYIVFLMLIDMFGILRNRLPPNLSKLPYLRTSETPYTDERWKPCIIRVRGCFDDVLVWKYGQLYHQINKERKLASELATFITDALRERLQTLDWLDKPSRKAALNKLKQIQHYYEYPSWIDNVDTLTKHYANLTMGGTIVANNMKCKEHAQKDSFSNLILPPRKKQWPSPLMVNAFYNPQENNIKISEGILDQPTYAPNRLRIMNFAELGYIIGHEITHAFDTGGVQFNVKGNKILWLSVQSLTRFLIKTKCLIDQYNKYELKTNEISGSIDEIKIHGTVTLKENIADQGGLILAYNAYKKFVALKGREIMPGILTAKNYTESQIFFLMFARTWCAKYYFNDKWKATLDASVHAPYKFRVNGPLSNFKTFSDVFHCPLNSAMNRGRDACQIW